MILITGASGLLGGNLAVTAYQRSENLVAVYNNHAMHMPHVESVSTDLSNSKLAAALMNTYHPSWIIHCAGLADVDRCEENPEEAWRLNVELAENLASAAEQHGIGLLYISTDSVFGGDTGSYSEADIPAPLNVYARSKLAGENAVRRITSHYLIVRTNIYGWNMHRKTSLAEWMLQNLESGVGIRGFTDVIFAPILVNDLSELLLDMIKCDLTGLFHVGGAESCSKYEFALYLADVFGLRKELVEPVSIEDSGMRAPRPKNTSLQSSKIRQALRRPMPDLKSGLKRFKALRDSGFREQLRSFRGEDYGEA